MDDLNITNRTDPIYEYSEQKEKIIVFINDCRIVIKYYSTIIGLMINGLSFIYAIYVLFGGRNRRIGIANVHSQRGKAGNWAIYLLFLSSMYFVLCNINLLFTLINTSERNWIIKNKIIFSFIYCNFIYPLEQSLLAITHLLTLLISVDRFVAMVFPFKYATTLSTLKIYLYIMILTIWTIVSQAYEWIPYKVTTSNDAENYVPTPFLDLICVNTVPIHMYDTLFTVNKVFLGVIPHIGVLVFNYVVIHKIKKRRNQVINRNQIIANPLNLHDIWRQRFGMNNRKIKDIKIIWLLHMINCYHLMGLLSNSMDFLYFAGFNRWVFITDPLNSVLFYHLRITFGVLIILIFNLSVTKIISCIKSCSVLMLDLYKRIYCERQ